MKPKFEKTSCFFVIFNQIDFAICKKMRIFAYRELELLFRQNKYYGKSNFKSSTRLLDIHERAEITV